MHCGDVIGAMIGAYGRASSAGGGDTMSDRFDEFAERAQQVLVPGASGPSAVGALRAANRGMTREELDEFLARPWNAKIGCVTEDGSPYVVPTWYEWDGQGFWLVPRARSAWARYFRRDPRVCLCIDQERAPHARVQVQGRAE